jgi:hypothetical protein
MSDASEMDRIARLLRAVADRKIGQLSKALKMFFEDSRSVRV